MFYLCQITYKLSINLTKLSILALYLRIFTRRWFRALCWILVALVLSYTTASVLVPIFQCRPVSKAWNKAQAGRCVDIEGFWYANAVYNIATDLLIAGSVPPVIWALGVNVRQRAGLCAVFGLVVL